MIKKIRIMKKYFVLFLLVVFATNSWAQQENSKDSVVCQSGDNLIRRHVDVVYLKKVDGKVIEDHNLIDGVAWTSVEGWRFEFKPLNAHAEKRFGKYISYWVGKDKEREFFMLYAYPGEYDVYLKY